MAAAGNLVARLRLDAKQFNKVARSTERRVRTMSKQMQTAGRAMATSLSLPLALAGGAATKVLHSCLRKLVWYAMLSATRVSSVEFAPAP